MIVNKNGRTFSLRTDKEEEAFLQKELESLDPDERETLEVMLQELKEKEDSAGLMQQAGRLEYKTTPVDMKTFVYDPYYLGHTCDNLYPKLLDTLTEVFEGGYQECILTGSIGFGKTFTASIGICRVLYELSCMVDPHRSFGLAKDSNISIVCLSVSEMLATKVVFENIVTKIDASTYFRENFPFEKTKKELRFPNSVWVASRATTDTSALGLNTISGLVDECLHGDAAILLASGEQVKASTLLDLGKSFRISTFDFSTNEAISADAFIKKSSDQECFELQLDDGSYLRVSGNHPIAVIRANSWLFIEITDIVDGDEVITYAAMDRRSSESTLRKDQATSGRRPLCRNAVRLDSGTKRACISALDTGEESNRIRTTSEANDRRSQSFFWKAPLRRNQEGNFGTKKRNQGESRDASKIIRYASWEENPHRRIQDGFSRAKSDKEFQTFGRNQAKTIEQQCVADEERGLSVQGIRGDDQSRHDRFSQSMGTESSRNSGFRSRSDLVSVRETDGSLYSTGRQKEMDIAGLSSCHSNWNSQSNRSETERLSRQLERETKIRSRSEILRGARLGIRGLGRELTVARVVAKNRLGVCPTYDVSVPEREVYIASGVLVHNTNFMPKVTGAKAQDPRFAGMDRAEVIYNAIKRRMKSRFEKFGKLPGVLFIMSSKATQDDFTARRINESKNDPSIYVADYSLWDVKPEDYYNVKRFNVLAGNEQVPSRLLLEGEAVQLRPNLPEGCVILDVPEDFRNDFEKDLEGSIRDLGGISTLSVSPFIQRREKIIEAIDKTRKHPFSTLVYDASRGGMFRWELLVKQATTRKYGRTVTQLMPIINPDAPRHIHVDPSLRKDALGFCMAHISTWVDVIRSNPENPREKYKERAPYYIVDFMLRVLPPTGGEIILGDIRRLIYELSDHGFTITTVSMDSFNSADGLQQLAQKGYNALDVSVDVTPDPYDNLKTAFYENRISFYEYEPVLGELRSIEQRWTAQKKRKIDHPPKKSKDISDALAGCLWTLSQGAPTSIPLAPMKSLPAPTGDDAWLEEQQHAEAAGQRGASRNTALEDYGLLPPFLSGRDDPDDSGGGWGRGGLL